MARILLLKEVSGISAKSQVNPSMVMESELNSELWIFHHIILLWLWEQGKVNLDLCGDILVQFSALLHLCS